MTPWELVMLPYEVLSMWRRQSREMREKNAEKQRWQTVLDALPEPQRTFADLERWIEKPEPTWAPTWEKLSWRIPVDLDQLVRSGQAAYTEESLAPVLEALRTHRPDLVEWFLNDYLHGRANPPQLKPYWVSWHHNPEDGPFNLKSPWWSSGVQGNRELIHAAVRAYSEEDAKRKVLESYDWVQKKFRSRGGFGLPFVSWSSFDLGLIEWEICGERPSDWSPWAEEFPHRDDMEW